MSQEVVGDYLGRYVASAALKKGVLVKLSSGKLAAAGLAEEWIGVLENETFADGDEATIRMRNSHGTVKMLSSGGFSAGAVVYGRASGKVDDISTSSAIRAGITLETAGGADELVEVMLP